MNQLQPILIWTVRLALLSIFIPRLYGCSIINAGIGAVIDAGKPDTDTLVVDDTRNLKSGNKIRVSFIDSTILEGIYIGPAPLDSARYAERYENFLDSAKANSAFPRLGDILTLHSNAGNEYHSYLFRGYGIGCLKVQKVGETSIENLPLTGKFLLKRKSGSPLNLNILQRMNEAGQLPRNGSLVMKTRLDTLRIPIDDIKYVEKTTGKTKWWALGLIVDAVLIAMAASKPFGAH